MEGRISATELARQLGDILGRVQYRGDSFLVERNGEPVARLVPLPGRATITLREAFAAWRGTGRPDAGRPGAYRRRRSSAREALGLVIDTSALVSVERASGTWEAALSTFGDEPAALPAIVCAELLAGVHLARSTARAAVGGGRSMRFSPGSRSSTSDWRSLSAGRNCSQP